MRSSKRVLLVEDEATLRSIIARNLAARGHTVAEADSTREALSRLSEARPDLMLLDINLPDRSGWDILREMRLRGWDVPVVIISAVSVSPARLEEFRPLAFLPKPFPLEALLRVVEDARPKERELVR
jgi:DNA-binding response OmpR family regulator